MFDHFKQYHIKNYRFLLIIYTTVLNVFGIFVIGSAKQAVQNKQILGFMLGFGIMIFLSFVDYNLILRFAWIIYATIVVLLTLVRLMGESSHGSNRWIEIAGIQFQPSELAKIGIILFFSYFFSKHREKLNTIKILVFSLVLVACPLLLILIQPDLSTTIMTTLIFVSLLYIAGLSYKIILTVLGITVPVGTAALLYLITHAQQIMNSNSKKAYQLGRIMSWLDPVNPLYSEKAAQQQNSIMAIGSGQLWGKGLNNAQATSLKNSNYIMEPQTDFIFTVVGEELGFVGCIVIIILLCLICFECLMIARRSKHFSGRLIACGMASLVAFQSIINIFVTIGFFPNTGIPLPFVSYGLTSLVSIYIGMGIVLNVGLQPDSSKRGGLL